MEDSGGEECGACALQPVVAFIHEHTPCGACFDVTVRMAEDDRRFSLTCSRCHARFSGMLPGPDARYAVILQAIALISGN